MAKTKWWMSQSTFNIPSAVSISVLERSWIDLIDDCIFPPTDLILTKTRGDPNDQNQKQQLHFQPLISPARYAQQQCMSTNDSIYLNFAFYLEDIEVKINGRGK